MEIIDDKSEFYTGFLKRLSEYYGRWKPTSVYNEILLYLKKEIAFDRLDILYNYILLNHPIKYGPPSIADIEKAIRDQLNLNPGSREVRKRNIPGYSYKKCKKNTANPECDDLQIEKPFEELSLIKMFEDCIRNKKIEE